MKHKLLAIIVTFAVLCTGAFASPLSPVILNTLPKQTQQILSFDYRAVRDSGSTGALRERLMPENMKRLESVLRASSLNPEKDVDQVTIVLFRDAQGSLKTIGIAQSWGSMQGVASYMQKRRNVGQKYRSNRLYSIGSGTVICLIDPVTLVYGNADAVHAALDARDGVQERLDVKESFGSMIQECGSSPIWSVLDRTGTQVALHSALDKASTLADFRLAKREIQGAYYAADLSSGMKFRLVVPMTDALAATTMSALVKAGVMYESMTATPAEKTVLDSIQVESDSGRLKVAWNASEEKLHVLLTSNLFSSLFQ